MYSILYCFVHESRGLQPEIQLFLLCINLIMIMRYSFTNFCGIDCSGSDYILKHFYKNISPFIMSSNDLLLSPEKVNQLLVKDLRSELRSRSLATAGKKSELRERLLTHLTSTQTSSTDPETDAFYKEFENAIEKSTDFDVDDNTNIDDVHDFEKVLYELEHGHLPSTNGQQTNEEKIENEEEKHITLDEEIFENKTKTNESIPVKTKNMSELEKELIKQSRIQRFGSQVISNADKIKSRKRRFSANASTDPSTKTNELYSDFSLKTVLDLDIDSVLSLKEKINERQSKFGICVDEQPLKKQKISQMMNEDKDKIQQRMQRFGIIDEKSKIQNRKERFASNQSVDMLDCALGGKNLLLVEQTLDEIVQKQKRNRNRSGRGGRRGNRRGRGGSFRSRNNRGNGRRNSDGGIQRENQSFVNASKVKERKNRFSDFQF